MNADRMNRWLMSAGLLALFTAAVHVVAGGRGIASPLLASTLAEVPRITLYGVWHLVSLVLALSGAALLLAARPRALPSARWMVAFIGALWLGFGLVLLAIAALQPGDGWWLKLPQWLLLMPVGALALAALRRPHRSGAGS
jgi:hypothetical protein